MEPINNYNGRYVPPKHSWGYAEAMIKEAKRYKMWIVFRKVWYSPDEFSRYIQSKDCRDYSGKFEFDGHELKIANPIPVIEKMRAAIQKKQEEIEANQKALVDFATRVGLWYRGGDVEK